jgi:DNA-binding CsgD family transcriptional regulator
MKLMLVDKSATEIAETLEMNPHTVRTHWRNILQKTNCHTQKKLKELALAEGWI